MIQDPRHIALNVLLFWHKASSTLDTALETYSKEISELDPKDKKLCNALVFGVLRKREAIDWIIDEFSNIDLKKISINLLYILRIALFQIIYMDRIPVFAAINTSVDIAKKLTGRRKAGFINAVLRKASTNYTNISLPDSNKNPSKFISIKYSLPLWLSKKWIEVFGFENTQKLGSQINTIPYITIRTNTLKTKRQNLLQKISLKVKSIQEKLISNEKYISQILRYGIDLRVSLHSFGAAYNYWVDMTTENLPANLIQAQRDFFGSHTYQRTDGNLDNFYHTNWN